MKAERAGRDLMLLVPATFVVGAPARTGTGTVLAGTPTDEDGTPAGLLASDADDGDPCARAPSRCGRSTVEVELVAAAWQLTV